MQTCCIAVTGSVYELGSQGRDPFFLAGGPLATAA